jgi:hypothetical protein
MKPSLVEYWWTNLWFILGDLATRDWFGAKFDIYFGFWYTVHRLKYGKVYG